MLLSRREEEASAIHGHDQVGKQQENERSRLFDSARSVSKSKERDERVDRARSSLILVLMSRNHDIDLFFFDFSYYSSQAGFPLRFLELLELHKMLDSAFQPFQNFKNDRRNRETTRRRPSLYFSSRLSLVSFSFYTRFVYLTRNLHHVTHFFHFLSTHIELELLGTVRKGSNA